MAVHRAPSHGLVAQVVNYHVVCVYVNRLVANYKLLVGATHQVVASRNENVGVPYGQPLILQGEVLVFPWVVLIEPKKEEPNFPLELIC